MKKLLIAVFLISAAVALGQPTTPINNARFTGNSTVLSGATLTIASGATIVAEAGSTVTGFGGGGGGSGTVTSIPDGSTNGVTWTVATRTTTPTFTFSLGAIVPTSVNSVVLSGSSTPALAVTGTTAVSGTNTGDQNIIQSVAVSGGNTVTSASTSGTITLVAGGNVTLVGNNTTKNITISASGGGGGGNTSATTTMVGNNVAVGDGTTNIKSTPVTINTTSGDIITGGNISANAVTLTTLTVTELNATNLTLTNQVSVPAGGTNLTTITANNIITGNGTGTPILIAPGTSGNHLISNGTAFQSTALGTNVNTWLVTPSLTNLNSAVTGDSVVGLAATQTLTNKIVSFSGALGTDDTYSGLAVSGLLAGATIAQWEAVYLDGSSTWQLADANGSGTYPAVGLAVAAYSSTNPAIVVYSGTVRNDAWSWTPGGVIYLSATAGGLTQTAPATSGDKVQQIGRALTADIILLNVNSEYLTVQ